MHKSNNLNPKEPKLHFVSPPEERKAGWFHTSREKQQLGFKASPRFGEKNGSGVKSHATFTRNQDLCIFLSSDETTLPPEERKGVLGTFARGLLITYFFNNRYISVIN
ncbi:hypothetical protein LC605_07235 [Nostoc sp. CHAB 5836]|nr:hypothetical protein [Nostoc sp. CHAB 5836]